MRRWPHHSCTSQTPGNSRRTTMLTLPILPQLPISDLRSLPTRPNQEKSLPFLPIDIEITPDRHERLDTLRGWLLDVFGGCEHSLRILLDLAEGRLSYEDVASPLHLHP